MRPDCTTELSTLLEQRILVLDGAWGTMIQQHRLDESQFRGGRFREHDKELRGNNDLLVLTRPDIVKGIHAQYSWSMKSHMLFIEFKNNQTIPMLIFIQINR